MAAQTQTILPSYLRGRWWSPENPQKVTEVADASTGEVVARVSTDGIDIASAVDYGRTVGQRSLGELTIHERALKLKELAQYLTEHKQELYDVSYSTGATLKDHFFDVDGGIATLSAYASRGRRELPSERFLVEGAPESLSKGGSFMGAHILTPLHGVAVHVNAYNFPCWGPLEKLAPAFLAGVPSIVKPATPTGFLTAGLMRLVVDSGLLPEGSVQFLAGSVGDLFDHLTEQDLVSFTGSASTARQLRTHPNLTRRAVRFTAEVAALVAASSRTRGRRARAFGIARRAWPPSPKDRGNGPA